MPMELRTGLPGTFKSCGAVEQLIKFAEDEAFRDRPRYALGVTGLRPDLAEPITEAQFKDWKSFPAGSIILVDEAQKVMPARRSGEPPQFIRDMSEHRHRGISFIFITQNPAMLDKYVRQLVDKHYHHVRKYGSMWAERWEFAECSDDPTSKSAKRIALGKEFVKASPEAMEAYTSAELHTIKTKVPKFIKVAVLLLLAVPVLGYLAYYKISHVSTASGSQATPKASSPPAPAEGLPLTGKAPTEARERGREAPMTRDEWVARFEPRVAGMPWSAPAYDDRAVEGIPELYCVIFGVGEPDEHCRCNTEQGTRATVPANMCKQMARDGTYNPYRKPRAAEPGVGQDRGQATDPQPVEVASASQPRVTPTLQPGRSASTVAAAN